MRIAAALALVLSVASARADKKAAERHHKRAETHYNLGRFDEAIVEFEKAYEEDPDPNLLFNLGQAHRMAGRSEQAIFFYKRYLSLRPDASNRAEIEERIAALENKPPQPLATPSPPPRPPWVRVYLELGFTSARLGGVQDEEVVPELGGRAGASANVIDGPIAVDAGVEVTLTQVSYDDTMGDAHGSSVTGLYGIATARYPVWRSLDLRADLGAGGAWWGGLVEGNPFTEGGRQPTGPLWQWGLRLAFGVEYRLREIVVLRATPLAVMGGLPDPVVRDQIDRFFFFEVLYVGIGVLL